VKLNFKYTKEAFDVTRKNFGYVLGFMLISLMHTAINLLNYKVYVNKSYGSFLGVLSYYIILLYAVAGLYSCLYQYKGSKITLRYLREKANEYYSAVLKTSLGMAVLGIVLMFIMASMIIPIGVLSFIFHVDLSGLLKNKIFMMSLLYIGMFIFSLLTIYAYAFVFSKKVMNAKSVTYGLNYFFHIIKENITKLYEVGLILFISALILFYTGIIGIQLDRTSTIYGIIMLVQSVLTSYLLILTFLIAAFTLRDDKGVDEFMSKADKRIKADKKMRKEGLLGKKTSL